MGKDTTEFDSPRELLRIIYWTLTLAIAIVFFLGMLSPRTVGPHRIIGLILIGIEALIWAWLSAKGREMF